MSGRRNCTKCGRWRPVTDFSVRTWAPSKTAPLYLQSHCRTCNRIKRRLTYKPKETKRRLPEWHRQQKRRAYHRRYYHTKRKDPKLPAQPFLDFVREQVMSNSLAGVARNVGCDEKTVKAYFLGQWPATKGYPAYDITQVKLSVVDQWLTSFGMNLWEVYPDL